MEFLDDDESYIDTAWLRTTKYSVLKQYLIQYLKTLQLLSCKSLVALRIIYGIIRNHLRVSLTTWSRYGIRLRSCSVTSSSGPTTLQISWQSRSCGEKSEYNYNKPSQNLVEIFVLYYISSLVGRICGHTHGSRNRAEWLVARWPSVRNMLLRKQT